MEKKVKPTPGRLAEVVADLLGKPLPTVEFHLRKLASEGLRTAGGRGRSAARMTPKDAAMLLIAVITSPALKDTIAAVNTYSHLVSEPGRLEIVRSRRHRGPSVEGLGSAWDLRFMPVPLLIKLSSPHTLLECLSNIIASAVSQELSLDSLRDHRAADIRFKLGQPSISAQVVIRNQHFSESRDYKRGGVRQLSPLLELPVSDLQTEHVITERSIHKISQILQRQGEAK